MLLRRGVTPSSSGKQWSLPGFVGPGITLLSGGPKSGKTTFAGHLVQALIEQKEFLGSTPDTKEFRIAWLGYDHDFDGELFEKFPGLKEKLFVAEGEGFNSHRWSELICQLRLERINLLVIDHLASLASGLDLDKQEQTNQVFAPIDQMIDALGIPVLLIAHASKTSQGRAAHSYFLEAKPRQLIRITGESKKNFRAVKVQGNRMPPKELTVLLTPEKCELKVSPKSSTSEQGDKPSDRATSRDEAIAVSKVAHSDALASTSALGRFLHQQGLAESPEAGRTKANRWKKMGFLEKVGGGNQIRWAETLRE